MAPGAGIFDLRPATTYEIELHVVDPDGSLDQTLTLAGATRADLLTDFRAAVDKAIADGTTLEDFFRERIFEPLRMDDTGFHVLCEDLPRLTAAFAVALLVLPLVALGYRPAEVTRLLKSVDNEGAGTEELIRRALQAAAR